MIDNNELRELMHFAEMYAQSYAIDGPKDYLEAHSLLETEMRKVLEAQAREVEGLKADVDSLASAQELAASYRRTIYRLTEELAAIKAQEAVIKCQVFAADEWVTVDESTFNDFAEQDRRKLYTAAPVAPAQPQDVNAELIALMRYMRSVASFERNDEIDAALANAKAPAQVVCTWGIDPDFEMGDTYRSTCGEIWSFIDGGPLENRVRFCQGCGKPVHLAAPPQAQKDGE